MNRVFIRRIDLPRSAKGVICEDGNGDYNIYLNSALEGSSLYKTLLHEIKHGANGHLNNDTATVSEKERFADI